MSAFKKTFQFYASFLWFTESLAQLPQTFINVDGKAIRHSGTEKALHIVSAWCHANQLVLAQEKVKEKSNEITALPKLLELLHLRGRIVTIDAMGAQREICLQKCKKTPDQSIKSLMRKNSMSFKHLLKNVKKIFHA